jgi:serine/threonine protein kinase
MRERIAHFQLLEKLGEGGMGVVYRARDEQLRRLVALKVLPQSVASDPDRKRKLLREARAAAALNHPNLAAIYQAGEDGDDVYVAMELVEGETVRRILQRDGPFPLERAIAISRAVLQALSRAHRAGIVHRDLKPDNLMIAEDDVVKVLDFGVARMDSADIAATATTEEGRVIGTPGYMSPEQALGKQVDARSDQFAFGVLLTELLTGKIPFRGTTAMERLVATTRDPGDLPSMLDPAVPKWIDRVVERCLQKDPSARYATCTDVIADLQRGYVPAAVTVDSIDVPSGLLVTPVSPPLQHNRTPLYLLAALVLFGALFFFATRKVAPPAVAPSPVASAAAPMVKVTVPMSAKSFARSLWVTPASVQPRRHSSSLARRADVARSEK